MSISVQIGASPSSHKYAWDVYIFETILHCSNNIPYSQGDTNPFTDNNLDMQRARVMKKNTIAKKNNWSTLKIYCIP